MLLIYVNSMTFYSWLCRYKKNVVSSVFIIFFINNRIRYGKAMYKFDISLYRHCKKVNSLYKNLYQNKKTKSLSVVNIFVGIYVNIFTGTV